MAVIEATTIDGVIIVEPKVWGDDRGFFVETFRQEWLGDAPAMVQANRADRRGDTLVGMHYHLHQADYWYVPTGEVLVALHDLRTSSPTDRVSLMFELGGGSHRGVYIPPGVAHGFLTRSHATVTYLVDHYHDPADELGVAWDDPELALEWPTSAPVLSDRDRANPRRAALSPDLLPG
jgi:dTDP-4-dehydrorhamnose 3,5-epimerase